MNFLKRRMHISRVSRIIPLNNIEEVETVFGKQFIVKTKPCKVCQTVQPIDNFYAKGNGEGDPCDVDDTVIYSDETLSSKI